jgi:hypothetical protein
MKFPLGQLVATPGALESFSDSFRTVALNRHMVGDWGDLSDDDKAMNDRALETRDRIHSSYRLGGKKLWIITEHDRSVTTLLLPEEN